MVYRWEDRQRRREVLQTEHGEEGSERGQDQYGSVESMRLLVTLQRRFMRIRVSDLGKEGLNLYQGGE